MANLPVKISADTKPLEQAFAKISDRAKELGKQFGEVGNDLGKGLTGFDVGKAMGIGGAVYAAGKLGEALVDAAKEGYAAFQKYQDAVLKFKYNAPSSMGTLEERGKMGKEMAETAESKVGIFSFQQLSAAGTALLQVAGELEASPEKINSLVDTMQALAIKTGATPDVIAENFRKLVVNIKEEGGAAVGKFFKATPGLEDEAGKLRSQHADDYLKGQGVTQENASGAQLGHFAEILAEPIAEFMTKESERIGGKESLSEIMGMMERAAPKSIISEEQDIHPEAALNAEMEKLSKAFGEDLAPAVVTMTKAITEEMPALRTSFSELASVLREAVIPSLVALGEFGKAATWQLQLFGGAVGWLSALVNKGQATDTSKSVDANIAKLGIDPAMTRGDYKPTPEATAAASAKGYKPYGDEHAALKPTEIEAAGSFTVGSPENIARNKEARTADDEAAKQKIKSDAAHAEAVARISFESTQAAFEHQTKSASRAALAQVNPNDTSLAGKENAESQSGEVKLIDIRAAAAAKIRALDEESAQKVAKIEEEMKLRDVTRSDIKTSDDSEAKKKASLDVLAAADAASQQQIDDLHADAAQKIRDENEASADKITDQQIETAKTISDTIRSHYDSLIAKHEGPNKFTPDEGPQAAETYDEWHRDSHGHIDGVTEGSHERKIREKANAEGQKAVDDANDEYQRQAEKAALNAVRKPGQSGETTPPGTPDAQHIAVNVAYDPKTGEKSGTTFDFGKGVSAQEKAVVILGEIYKAMADLAVA
jgi:hypothetical protein